MHCVHCVHYEDLSPWSVSMPAERRPGGRERCKAFWGDTAVVVPDRPRSLKGVEKDKGYPNRVLYNQEKKTVVGIQNFPGKQGEEKEKKKDRFRPV